ncbi:hypothetical protein IGB42_00116 [Andreprevotia sp. IGB-42]|uniref:flagellar protein FlaG n=1 Tax=Andreprevotia sp. IGB-42 TaxID=2497473 RepID=UPI00135A154A|nr:flagellar protein FlaG [Andreprevotia sp. IGB-42]KAF0815039.1 hypothetical protein IGB42_00116 [Andreprevotia sp. IGB-42]
MQIPSLSGLTASAIPSVADPSQRQSAPVPTGQSDLQSLNVAATAVPASDPSQRQQSLEDAVKKLNDTVKVFSNSNSLQFSIDEDTGVQLVKVIDTSTKEVVRQIPTEEALTIAKAIDQFKGMLIKEQA